MFSNNPYNQNICKTLVEGNFLDDFEQHMREQYFEQFVCALPNELQAVRNKLDVLYDVLNTIRREADNATRNQ